MGNAAAFRIAFRLRDAFSRRARARRMQWLLETIAPTPGLRVIDLGGVPRFWDACPVPLHLTILNLPGLNPPAAPPAHHRITLVDGDACATGFADGAFDFAFSNSVIEHVGDAASRARMAAEIRRLAPRYWVQTPSAWFPVEAHTLMPGWWAYPDPVKRRFIARWRRSRPGWTEMIEGTTVLPRREVATLFPEARILTERRAGLPKSYVALRA